MKRKSKGEETDELRPEYALQRLLRAGVQGKYASRYRQGTNLVLLDPEVARAFPTASAVNEALRLVMQLSKISNAGRKATAKA